MKKCNDSRVFATWTLLVAVWIALAPPPVAGSAERDSSYLAALQSLNVQQFKEYVDYLADDALEGREAGSPGGWAAGDYLVERFAKLKLQEAGENGAYFQPFSRQYRNVLAMLPGRDPALRDEVILIGAHYDHVGYGTARNSRGPVGYIHNGADDNASGVATLLELAEAMTMLPESPKRSILFVAWDAEEKGLLGSKHWTSYPTVPLDRVVCALNMDMVGRLRGDHLRLFGSRSGIGLRRLASGQNDDARLELEFLWTLKPNADHYAFFQKNIPVLTLNTGLHDEYHSPRDDAELINHEGMRRVAELMFGILYELAEGETVPRFRPAAHHETDAMLRQRLAQPPQLPERLGIRWREATHEGDGVVLIAVVTNSPAERAGLRPGDRIVQFAQREIRTGDDLRGAVLGAPKETLMVWRRDGETEPLEATVQLEGEPLRLGITWRVDEAEPGTIVLTHVVPGSPADRAGLAAGDRIYQVAGKDFADDAAFAELAATEPEPLVLLVERDGRLRTVTLHFSVQPAASRRAA